MTSFTQSSAKSMTATYSPSPFEAHCDRYDAWIIAYHASGLDSPRYLVWYRHSDASTDSQDRILSYKNGKMYAAQSLAAMQAGILDHAPDLTMSENVMDWLRNFGDLEVSANSTYDLVVIEEGLAAANLDIPTL